MSDNELLKINYEKYGDRMSDLSYVLVRFYWDIREVYHQKKNYKYICNLYEVYKRLLDECKDLNNLVCDMNTNWGKYYRLSYYKEYNYDFIDWYSPRIQLREIRKELLNMIPIHKIQRIYKIWYKKKLKNIKKIQRNWRASRYNPAYKLCWLIQLNNSNLFVKIEFKDLDNYINK